MKEFRYYYLIGLFLMGFYPSISQTQEPEMLTLEEAIRIALENNYDIRIAENDREVLDNNYGYGKYNFLPTIDASAAKNFDVEDFEQEFVGQEPRTGSNARSNQLSASVDLQWTIFDGLGMFIGYKRLDELRQLGQYNLRATVENSIGEISRAYYEIILEKAKIEVLRNTVGLSEKRLEIAKAVYEVGRSSKLEFLTAQVDYNTDVSALIEQEESYFNSKVNLNRLLGRSVDVDFGVEDTIAPDQNLDQSVIRERMMLNNASLLAAEANQRVTNLQTNEIRSERSPEINLNGGYVHNRSEAQSGIFRSNRTTGYYYGISANFNILNGRDITRRVQNARIDQENADVIYEQTEANLMADLNNTYVAYQNALRLIGLETDNFKLAEESEDIAYERYKLGVANFLELREAQRNAVAAESRLLDAVFNAKVAEIELLRLSGQIMQ